MYCGTALKIFFIFCSVNNLSFSLSTSKYRLVPSKYVFELSSLTISLVCNIG